MTSRSRGGGLLQPNEIQVWCASLDLFSGFADQLAASLSVDEQERSERFYFERDRRRYVLGQGLLRGILGEYLGLHPTQLRFSYGKRGKPELSEEFESEKLRFSLSRSQEFVLYGVTQGRAIGVDLEIIRPIPDAEEIAKHFFSRREVLSLLALPESQRLEAFLNCWTRKEAYLKALGDGLTRPLDRFDVSVVPGEPAELVRVEWDPLERERWSLHALRLPWNAVAALAAEGHDLRVTYGRLAALKSLRLFLSGGHQE